MLSLSFAWQSTQHLLVVRQYLEGMPESSQLMDLLSAGSHNIEPTMAAGRPPLYAEVRRSPSHIFLADFDFYQVLAYWRSHSGDQSRSIAPRTFQREPIQLLGGQHYEYPGVIRHRSSFVGER